LGDDDFACNSDDDGKISVIFHGAKHGRIDAFDQADFDGRSAELFLECSAEGLRIHDFLLHRLLSFLDVYAGIRVLERLDDAAQDKSMGR
jgi:hypothetical protein